MPQAGSNLDERRSIAMLAQHIQPRSGSAVELLCISSGQVLAAARRMIAAAIHIRESRGAPEPVFRAQTGMPLEILLERVHPLVPHISSQPLLPPVLNHIGIVKPAVPGQHAPCRDKQDFRLHRRGICLIIRQGVCESIGILAIVVVLGEESHRQQGTRIF